MAGYIFTHDEAKRVANAVKANEGRPHTRLPPRKRPYRNNGGSGETGGTQVIRFQIISVDCGSCSAIAFVKSRPVGVPKVTGEDDYGQVTIYDFRRCILTGPDLVDRQGMAALMTTNDFEAVCADPPDFEVGDTVTVWEVIDLCCADYGCGGNE